MLQGRLALLSALFCLPGISHFGSANEKPKPSDLGASGGLGTEVNLAFS